MSDVRIVEADLERAEHGRAVVALTNAYAMDPRGNDGPLSEEVLRQLVPALKRHPTTMIFLAYDGEAPVGIATCFVGFSTFAARPLVNIHDLAVLAEWRGRGVSRRLLEAVEAKARELGCCKVTLEVQETNHRAKAIYERAGFAVKWHESGSETLYLAKAL